MFPLVVEGSALKLQMLLPGYDWVMLVGDGFLGGPVIRFHAPSLASDVESHCKLGAVSPNTCWEECMFPGS